MEAHTICVTAASRDNGHVAQVAPNNSYNGWSGTITPPIIVNNVGVATGDLILESDNIFVGTNTTSGRVYCAGFTLSM